MSVFTNNATSAPEEASQYTAAVLGLLGDRDPVEVLFQTPGLLGERVRDLSDDRVRTPEAPGKWSVVQVVEHLADSELVGGYRFRMIVAHDRPAITGYDQDRWATRLHYDQADVAQALELFRVLREANLRLIAHASPDDLRRVGVHSERGEESLQLLVRLYAGHDLLHLRQIHRIRAAIGA
jgi:hypothetical protein